MKASGVLLDSNLINDSWCVSYPTRRSCFELVRFPKRGLNLKDLLNESYKEMLKIGERPRVVFIPLTLYALREQTVKNPEIEMSTMMICEQLGLTPIIVTPDIYKGKIAPIIKYEDL